MNTPVPPGLADEPWEDVYRVMLRAAMDALHESHAREKKQRAQIEALQDELWRYCRQAVA